MGSNTGAPRRQTSGRSLTTHRLAVVAAASAAGVVLAGGAVLLGVSPASADTFGGYEIAYQTTDHRLGLVAPSGTITFIATGVTAFTSPSVAGLATGGFMTSFVDQGQLWVGNIAGVGPHLCNGSPYVTHAGSSPSSPAIAAAATGDWETLAAINNNHFVDFGPGNTNCGPEITTAFPAVAGDVASVSTGRMVEAVVGTSGQLLVNHDFGLFPTAVNLDASTAPAIAGDYLGGATRFDGWKVAAHGADHRLWTVDSTGTAVQTSVTLAIGSNVDIARLSTGGYEIVYTDGSDGKLHKMAPDGTVSLVGTGFTPNANSGASIAADASGGFEIAFQPVSSHLTTVDQSNVVHDTFQNMPVGTTPSITALVVPGDPSPSPSASTGPPPTCTPGAQLLQNPGFESGNTIWSASPAIIAQNAAPHAPRSGTWDVWLDGHGTTHTDTLSQSVTIPAGCRASLSFWLNISTAEFQGNPFDRLTLQVNSTNLFTWSNVDAAAGYLQRTFDISSFAGQTVTVKFTGTEDFTLQTSFVIDDTSLTMS